ncbi:hypothetical protein EW145_g2555 [Phellinidium pouzarii]|uniref:DUF6534 domain-containing protein n=1 Tax=Phellinidium pouzarii TaxID=167371 RepID=A0A4S4LAT8_9AGAM|nr:hypothetical protein EW145_g2555 [Phellinidium pouzarii]
MSTTSLVGPLVIGTVVNAFVFGICVLQYIDYFSSGYKDDWKLLTLLVWVLAIDIFQSGATVAILWHYVVENFANVASLADSPWMYASLPIFSTLNNRLHEPSAAVPIQHFMAWRIMRFSKSYWLFVYISVLSLGQGALACASATMGLLSPSIASHVKIIPVADGWLAMSVACDTSITVLLLFYLNKSRTGFKRTDSIIFRLCRITVEAALPVSLLCILDLVFLTLNAREGLRKTMESSVHNSIQLGSRNLHSRIAPGNRTTEVHINVEQDVQLDQMKGVHELASSGGSGEETFYTETTPSSERKSNFA